MHIYRKYVKFKKENEHEKNIAHDSRSSFYFDTLILDIVFASDCFSITKGILDCVCYFLFICLLIYFEKNSHVAKDSLKLAM